MATLSCTDSSAASSEDASDPGSPYSPSSCDDSQQRPSSKTTNSSIAQTHGQPAAQHSIRPAGQSRQSECVSEETISTIGSNAQVTSHAWPWNANGGGSVPPVAHASTTTATKIAKNTSNKAKRVAVPNQTAFAVKKTRPNIVLPNGHHINGTNLKGSNADGTFTNLKPVSIVEAVKNQVDTNPKSKVAANFPTQTHIYNPQSLGAQTKITGFFKSQMKPLHTGIKKDLTNMAIRSSDFSPKSGLKKYCNQLSKPCVFDSHKVDGMPTNDIDVRALTSITPTMRKVERKTAKVAPLAPISRKSSTNPSTKKSLPPVLPKRPVNIAPRTVETPKSINNIQMMSPVKCADVQLQQKGILQSKIHQPTVLLTAIRIPPTQPKNIQQSKTTNKIGGPMFHLHSAPVMPKLVQIPNMVAPKETSTSSHNLVINNGGAHYFLNGAVIKLQQMPTQQHVSSTLDAVNNMLNKGQGQSFLQKSSSSMQSGMSADQSKDLEPLNDQSFTNHHVQSDQLSHHQFAQQYASAPTGPQFAQPVFMATSSGLLLTAALPTVMTSQLQNLQTMSHHHNPHHSPHHNPHQQPMPALHQFNQPPHTPSTNILPNIHATSFVSSPGNYPFVPMATTVSQSSSQVSTQANHQPPPTIINIPSPISSTITKTIASIASISPTILSAQSAALYQHKMATSITMASTTAIPALISSTPISSSISAPICVNAKPSDGGPPPLLTSSHHLRTTASVTVTVKPMVTLDLTDDSDQPEFNGNETAIHVIPPSPPGTVSQQPRLTKPGLSSPKSILLEKIQQKQPDDDNTISPIDGNTPKVEKGVDLLKPPTTIDTDLTVTSLPECSKSPILSQPKTIRFPVRDFANGSHRANGRTVGCCYWDSCNAKCETSSNLIDHLQTQHVNSQTGPFTCRWANCKVHGRESCSRKWLERHVLSHGGSKFFKCIFDKCRLRFSSHVSLCDYQNIY